jgi:signal transduction histidine kinase
MAKDGTSSGEIDPRWFAQIAEKTLDGLSIVEAVPDADGRIVDFVFRFSNLQAVELLRRSRAELIGRSVVEVFGDGQANDLIERWALALATGETLIEEIQVAPAFSSPRWLRQQVLPLHGAVAVFSHDISARRSAEVKLLLAEADAQRARRTAEQADRAKTLFLSQVAHDLRTPMNALEGFAELLDADELPADQADAVRHVRIAAAEVRRMVDQLLDLADDLAPETS